MFDLGMQELIVIFIVALLVFGPKKLPELGRSLGKGIGELKKAMHGVKAQMDAEMYDLKQPLNLDTAESPKEQQKSEETKSPSAEPEGELKNDSAREADVHAARSESPDQKDRQERGTDLKG